MLTAGVMTGTAEFSECQKFRYTLTRQWERLTPKLCVIGLNPSTATAETNDRTVRRCIGFAQAWGYGGLLMLNLYAYRATLPADMWARWKGGYEIIGGERNSFASLRGYIAAHNCGLTLGAWGLHGGERGFRAIEEISGLHFLTRNSDGSPGHPLYLRADLKPQPFKGAA
jgi:hypothetical protein